MPSISMSINTRGGAVRSPAQRNYAYGSSENAENDAWESSVSTLPNCGIILGTSHTQKSIEDLELYEPDEGQYSYHTGTIINRTSQHKRKFVGGGTLQSLSRYLDRYFEHNGLGTIGPRFVYGMQHAEEFLMPKLGEGRLTLPPM